MCSIYSLLIMSCKVSWRMFLSSFALLAMSPASVFVESSQMWFLSYHNHPLLLPARLDTATDLQPRELCYKVYCILYAVYCNGYTHDCIMVTRIYRCTGRAHILYMQ